MIKLKPRNKICFQNYVKPAYLRNETIKNYKKKKWTVLKKRNKNKIEKRKIFFRQRLFEKQEIKNFYGCLSNYKIKKLKYKNKNFIPIIESYLDINILRMKKAKTIFHARQLINHNKIKINNKIINKPNIILKTGDIINICNK